MGFVRQTLSARLSVSKWCFLNSVENSMRQGRYEINDRHYVCGLQGRLTSLLTDCPRGGSATDDVGIPGNAAPQSGCLYLKTMKPCSLYPRSSPHLNHRHSLGAAALGSGVPRQMKTDLRYEMFVGVHVPLISVGRWVHANMEVRKCGNARVVNALHPNDVVARGGEAVLKLRVALWRVWIGVFA